MKFNTISKIFIMCILFDILCTYYCNQHLNKLQSNELRQAPKIRKAHKTNQDALNKQHSKHEKLVSNNQASKGRRAPVVHQPDISKSIKSNQANLTRKAPKLAQVPKRNLTPKINTVTYVRKEPKSGKLSKRDQVPKVTQLAQTSKSSKVGQAVVGKQSKLLQVPKVLPVSKIAKTNNPKKIILDVPVLAHSLPYKNQEDPTLESYLFKNSPIVIANKEKTLQAYVGVLSANPNKAVVSFRGTANANNAFTDLNFSKTILSECDPCAVHTGFKIAYESLEKEMFNSISKLLKENPNLNGIAFLGHSLGGAMTTLAAFKFLIANKNKKSPYSKLKEVSLITLGAPRVGNELFANILNESGLKYNLRIIYGSDLIPAVPPKIMDFMHAGTEIRYLKNEKENYDNPVLGNQFEDTCEFNIQNNILDHTKYKNINSQILWEFIKKIKQ